MCVATFSTHGVAADKNAVLAEVGGKKLEAKVLEEQIANLPPQMQMMLAQNPQIKKQFVERWVDTNLLALEAQKTKLDQDPAVKNKLDEAKTFILAQEYVIKEIEKKINVTDADVKAYFEKNKAEFSEPESVKASHILVKVPQDADEKAWKDAEAKIKDIKKKLDGGADFAKLAQEMSDDPGSKAKGGDLGFFSKGRMVPEFEAAAFALKPGEVSQPVKTPFGYHLIKVVEKKDAHEKSFDEVKDQVKQNLLNQKRREALDAMLLNLKKQYSVKINETAIDETGKAPADAAPAAPAATSPKAAPTPKKK
jgi:peptidyl-prolyl cis-trans isomerase C